MQTYHCFVIFLLYFYFEVLILFQFKQVKKALAGVDTWYEVVLNYVQNIINKIFHTDCRLYENARRKRFRKMFFNKEENCFKIKDAKIPFLDINNEKYFPFIFDEAMTSYYYFGDSYDENTYNKCDEFLGDGLYGFVNDKVNVTVEPGDVVIDAGSWIGDFAAYASAKAGKSGTVFAFEPTDETFKTLKQTAKLNGNIIPIKKGLSNKNESASLFLYVAGSSFSNSLMNKESDGDFVKSSNTAETIRLDDFVRENNLTHVDFIKSDIEGFERNMLEGAQETLKRFAPKLALCTYHLPDDPEVMAALIKKANPAYNIVQKRKKLYASVPK